jgi:acetolactate synthase-1/2/3 large subunit
MTLNHKYSPQESISLIGRIKCIFRCWATSNVGSPLINCQPKKWISSSGLGTMGFGLPAAIGAKVGNPKQDVVCISGDSSIQMSIQN